MKKLLFIAFAAFTLWVPVSAFAQGGGFPPFSSVEGGGFDAVNLSNLNVISSIPIASFPGRGEDFSYAISYNSLVYQRSGWAWVPSSNWGWQTGEPVGESKYFQNTGKCWSTMWGGYIWLPHYHNYRYVDAAGTVHLFDLDFLLDDFGDCDDTSLAGPREGAAIDGSGFYVDATTPHNPVVTTPGGGIVPENTPSFDVTDRNGNKVSKWVISTSEAGWKDTRGLTVLKVKEVSNTLREYRVLAENGTYQLYSLTSTAYRVTTDFNCYGVTEYDSVTTTIYLPTELLLPNGQKYLFEYEDNPSLAGRKSGRLSKVTLPTGGTYEYVYPTAGTRGILCTDGTMLTLTRKINPEPGTTTHESVWDYNRVNTGVFETTIKAPDYLSERDETVVSFTGVFETKRELYEGSVAPANKLRTIDTVRSSLFGAPVSRTVKLEDGTILSKSETVYDSRGRLTLLKEYDGGAATPTRTTRWLHNGFANYVDRNLNNLVMEIEVYEGDWPGGTLVAETKITYDTDTTLGGTSGIVQHNDTDYPATMIYRGNPTKVEVWRDDDGKSGGATWITTLNTFNDLGNLTLTTDPGGHDTTFDYTDSWEGSACTISTSEAHVTTVTNALFPLATMTFYPCTSLMASVTDANVNSTDFAHDVYGRLEQVDRSDAGVSTLAYNVTTRVISGSAKIESTLNLTTETEFDKLGRFIQSRLTSDPVSTIYSDTTYDPLGRRLKVSTPYRSTSEATYGLTEVRYDALGRSVLTIPPDGSAASNNMSVSYDKNCSIVTDQTGKTRKSCTDGLGRLTKVWEPNSSGSFVHQTVSTYDVLDNLIKVEQKASGSSSSEWRTRTMTYNSLSQMLSIDNPETGILSYGYDSEGNMDKRTDARSIITTYTYDPLHRMAQVSYSDATPTVKYFYDGEIPNGTNCSVTMVLTPAYPEGRMTGMCDGAGGEAWGYDKMGRIANHKRTTSGSPMPRLQYGYNLGGGLTTITAAWSGWTQIYGYNAVGQVTGLSDSTGNNYASGITYHPHGAMRTRSLDGGSMFQQHLFNKRLQPCRLFVRASGTTPVPTDCADASPATGRLMDFKLEYDEGTADNGSLTKLTDHVQGIVYDYTYDEMNRIKTAAATGSSPWSQGMDYDAWGNMNIPTASNAPILNLSKDEKNRIKTSAHPAYDYDLSGNQTEDPGVPGTMEYDAEGRIISIGTAIEYKYDGLGRRVLKKTDIGGASEEHRAYVINAVTGAVYQERVFDGTSWVHDRYRFHLNGVQLASQKNGEWWKYTFQDQLGTMRVRTNRFGTNVISRHDFYPYGGEHTIASTEEFNVFTQQERDGESGLDHFWFRKYQSISGRWTSPDPLFGSVGNPQSLNRYAYVGNDPLNFVDPFGLQKKEDSSCDPKKDKNCLKCEDKNNDGEITPVDECERGHETVEVSASSSDGIPESLARLLLWSSSQATMVGDWGSDQATWWGAYGKAAANPVNIAYEWTNAEEYRGCVLNQAGIVPMSTPTAGHLLVTSSSMVAGHTVAPEFAAGAYYFFTDARFTQWGKFSRVLVPRAATAIRVGLRGAEGAAAGLLIYEWSGAMYVCQDKLR